jgi:DNA-binding transcriptional ArsR family regulator
MGDWNLLSNHGMALICVARNPDSRLRDVAECVGITERAAHRIVSDLVDDGYLDRKREGNRNRYELNLDVPIHHPLLEDHWVGELLAVLVSDNAAFTARQP